MKKEKDACEDGIFCDLKYSFTDEDGDRVYYCTVCSRCCLINKAKWEEILSIDISKLYNS